MKTEAMAEFDWDAYFKSHKRNGLRYCRRAKPRRTPDEERRHRLFLRALAMVREGQPIKVVSEWSRGKLGSGTTT